MTMVTGTRVAHAQMARSCSVGSNHVANGSFTDGDMLAIEPSTLNAHWPNGTNSLLRLGETHPLWSSDRMHCVGAPSLMGVFANDWPVRRATKVRLPVAMAAQAPTMSRPLSSQESAVSTEAPPQQQSEQSSSSRDRRYSFWPAIRFGFGAAMGPGASSSFEGGFSFDATVGVIAFQEADSFGLWRLGVQFLPELGLATQSGPSPGGTYFRAGSSVLLGTPIISGGLSAHGLVGGSSAGFAAGLRSGAIVQFLLTAITIELAYQYLPTATDNRHALVGTIALNPIPVIALLFMTSIFSSQYLRWIR
jgi:hypothetical protein